MRSVKKLLIMLLSTSLVVIVACNKKDDSKPVPKLIPQGSAQDPKQNSTQQDATQLQQPQSDIKKAIAADKNAPKLSSDTDKNKSIKTPEDKAAPTTNPNSDGAVNTAPKELLDVSKARLIEMTANEAQFVESIYAQRLDAELRAKNFENKSDVNASDLGLLSSAKLISTDANSGKAEVRLHLVSLNKIIVFSGDYTKGEIMTLKSTESGALVRALCADDKCDFLIGYAAEKIEKSQDKAALDKMLGTFIFKRSGDEYLSTKVQETPSEEEVKGFAALKAEQNLTDGIEKFGEKVVEDLKKKIRAEKSWYSADPFLVNLSSERDDLTLSTDNKFVFNLVQFFNKESDTTRLKNYSLKFEGQLGKIIVAKDAQQDIEMSWTQLTKNFGYGIFKTTKYVSHHSEDKNPHLAYLIKWCGFEPVTVNSTTMQLDKCDYMPAAVFLGTKNDKGEVDIGPAEGGLK